MASIINAATSGGLISTADTSGILQLQTASTTAVTVDASQNVLVGATTSAAGKLVVKDTASSNTVWLVGRTSDGASSVSFRNAADSAYTGRIELDPSVGMLVGTTGATTQLTLANAGNLGLGVTPSAWATLTGLQVKNACLGGVANETHLIANAFYNASWKYISTGFAARYSQNDVAGGAHAWFTAPSGTAGNAITFTQAMTLDASGNLGLGLTAPDRRLHVASTLFPQLRLVYTGVQTYDFGVTSGGLLSMGVAGTNAVNIDSSGNLLVGTTNTNPGGADINGIALRPGNFSVISALGATPLGINRGTDDGTLISFSQAGSTEGSISVSGTTVSYNGGHLSRWAQTTTAKDESLVKGTVLSNLDEMNVYTKDGQPVANEQLNKVKVSDTEGDVNVAGVFVNWSHDDAHNVDEINMAMTGDMIIRIAQGVTVVRGDLLMSAGDGTAKPQGDDIVRSKTVAKVTSNHITCTYADGSYCVPCVLMAC